MKKFKKIFSVLLATLCLFCTACQNGETPNNSSSSSSGNNSSSSIVIEETDIVLAEGKSSPYKIVVPVESTDSIDYAARQLKEYMYESTGATLPIINDSGIALNEDDKYISLGQTTIFQGTNLTVGDEELNRDGFKIYRYGNTVVICGARDIGTTYGVYEFLKQEIGFEAYASNEVDYQKVDKLYLRDFALTDKPDFRGRATDGYISTDHVGASLLRIRTFESRGAEYDYGGGYDCIPNHSETFYNLLSEGVYYDKDKHPETYHPEWWEASGKKSLQFCLTNEAAIAEFIKNSLKYVDENPRAEYFHISECDGAGWCQCSVCKAEQNAYGIAGYKIRFTNKIIEAIEAHLQETNPTRELRYVALAYGSGTIVPPVKTTENGYVIRDESCRPHKKLYMQLTPIDYCYSHTFDDPKCSNNATFYEYIKGWQSITDRFCVYDYGISYDHYFRYFNNFDAFQRDLQIYKEIGVEYIFRQYATGGNVSSMAPLYNYLFGKLTWDVDQDVEALIENFMNHYYKKAAPQMKEYFYTLRTHFRVMDTEQVDSSGKYQVHFRIYWNYARPLEDVSAWPKNLMIKLSNLCDEAMAVADDNTILERVQKESLCPKYLELKFYKSYYSYDKEEYLNKITAMEDLTTLLGVTYWKERKAVGLLYEDWRNAA